MPHIVRCSGGILQSAGTHHAVGLAGDFENGEKMKILVTGGTGFTGSHLVERLLDDGHKVVVLDNLKGIVHDTLLKKGTEIHIGSVTDTELIKQLVPGCEVIHHLAAAFRKVNLPKNVYYETNVTSMRNLLQTAKDNKVRKFVYCST